MQWFVSMDELSKPALRAVMDELIEFYPPKFKNTYRHWMENIKDWCISRQLWWGHRIPAFYCAECDAIIVSETVPTVCKCGCSELTQDDDTLDTWFSSALWPFSTLGWPEKTPELEYFYPTNVIVPAYDIIFFWVARMVFSGLKFMDDVPFRDVFIHGLIRDSKGKKMSKSAGNGVDPLEIIEQYGADALRLVMVHGVSQESDIRWSENKILAARNFANKLWNAARFVLMNLDENAECMIDFAGLKIEDKWILSKYNRLVKEVTLNLEAYNLGVAVGKIHDFIWNVYCDWYIELTKSRRQEAFPVLTFVMDGFLKLLHPFMPFITEEIWQALPGGSTAEDSIMIAPWPEWRQELDFTEEEAQFDVQIARIKDERAAAQAKEDRVKEVARLEKELVKAKENVMFIESKLSNTGFVTKAPPAQVENERAKLAKGKERLKEIEDALKREQ
jgi:valyl-tRNA synthetase